MLEVRKPGIIQGLIVLTLMLVGSAFAQSSGTMTQADFTGVATQILTYLGYAVAAGLTVLVAFIAAKRGWTFFRSFL
jgi:hypothetical protein